MGASDELVSPVADRCGFAGLRATVDLVLVPQAANSNTAVPQETADSKHATLMPI